MSEFGEPSGKPSEDKIRQALSYDSFWGAAGGTSTVNPPQTQQIVRMHDIFADAAKTRRSVTDCTFDGKVVVRLVQCGPRTKVFCRDDEWRDRLAKRLEERDRRDAAFLGVPLCIDKAACDMPASLLADLEMAVAMGFGSPNAEKHYEFFEREKLRVDKPELGE